MTGRRRLSRPACCGTLPITARIVREHLDPNVSSPDPLLLCSYGRSKVSSPDPLLQCSYGARTSPRRTRYYLVRTEPATAEATVRGSDTSDHDRPLLQCSYGARRSPPRTGHYFVRAPTRHGRSNCPWFGHVRPWIRRWDARAATRNRAVERTNRVITCRAKGSVIDVRTM
jgi:hypothetical protein